MINVSFGEFAEDITPLSPEEIVLSPSTSLDEPVPCDYIITVDSVEKALSQIKTKTQLAQILYQTRF